MKHRNVIFERAKFNSCKQESGESVDTFIMHLQLTVTTERYMMR